MKKQFNWDTALGSPQKVLWLKANHNKKLSLEEFMKSYRDLRQYSIASRKKWKTQGRKSYQPNRMRKQYNYLKDNFGFFE